MQEQNNQVANFNSFNALVDAESIFISFSASNATFHRNLIEF